MKKGWMITCIVTLLILLGGISIIIVYGSKDTIPKGFQLAGLNVAGQDANTALQQIHERISKLQSSTITVTLPLTERSNVTPEALPTRTLNQLGMHIEATEAIKDIENFRDTSRWNRALIRYQKSMHHTYGIKVAWDEKKFQEEISSTWGAAVKVHPTDAIRTINELDQVVYTPETIGTGLDGASLFAAVKAYGPKSLALLIGEGETIGTIELPVIQTAPPVTIASLKEEGISRKIIEFTTSFKTSGEGRIHNVTAAAKALNETLLMPDEVFEYGEIVDSAEKEYGYKEAPVILNGKLTPGIGGGICQVSSTLYNAALLAGLEIVERRNHSLVVSYLPKGLDATFADGYINFKFRNSTGKQLLIRTVIEDKSITVKLFGTMPEEVTYRTDTVQLKETPAKIVYVPSQELTIGKQTMEQNGSPGYTVESFLLKLVHGEVVERKRLSKDTYRSQDTVIAVNPNDPRIQPNHREATPEPTASPEAEKEGPIEPV